MVKKIITVWLSMSEPVINDRANACTQLGELLTKQGKPAEAEVYHAKALELKTKQKQ